MKCLIYIILVLMGWLFVGVVFYFNLIIIVFVKVLLLFRKGKREKLNYIFMCYFGIL